MFYVTVLEEFLILNSIDWSVQISAEWQVDAL